MRDPSRFSALMPASPASLQRTARSSPPSAATRWSRPATAAVHPESARPAQTFLKPLTLHVKFAKTLQINSAKQPHVNHVSKVKFQFVAGSPGTVSDMLPRVRHRRKRERAWPKPRPSFRNPSPAMLSQNPIMLYPQSTYMVSPVIALDRSLARNSAAPPTSS